MTITLTKTKLVFAIVALALAIPATAIATDSWSDVEDGKFYHDAVTWAKDNGMTTGCDGGTGFCPDRPVTRGENITFAKRYDDFVVQPALDDKADSSDVYTKSQIKDMLPMWATIEPGGDVYSGSSGLVSSTKTSTGKYVLTWDRDVDECAATTADIIFVHTRDVTADPTSGDDDETVVYVTGETGTLEDTWFSIAVHCANPDEELPVLAAAAAPNE